MAKSEEKKTRCKAKKEKKREQEKKKINLLHWCRGLNSTLQVTLGSFDPIDNQVYIKHKREVVFVSKVGHMHRREDQGICSVTTSILFKRISIS